uniref:Succinate-semialdehyde dehydrogenase, mitochondrial n=1 Tax=Ascaris lumbricoides TaxID=6252 RepID=A0A0M3IP93_ASCLU
MLRASEVVLRRSSQILLNAARCQATASIPAPEEVRANQPIYTKLFINNEWRNSMSGKTFTTYDPSTCNKIAEIQEADKADVDIAVKVRTTYTNKYLNGLFNAFSTILR